MSRWIRASLATLILLAGGTSFGLLPGEQKPAPKKPQSRPANAAPKTPATDPKASPPVESRVQTTGGITVRENYFLELPGVDISTLTPKQKNRFLERVNTEICTCGCPNDTIARCLVNDPKCGTVRGLAEKVLSEVKTGR